VFTICSVLLLLQITLNPNQLTISSLAHFISSQELIVTLKAIISAKLICNCFFRKRYAAQNIINQIFKERKQIL
jgi:hypothetical protein